MLGLFVFPSPTRLGHSAFAAGTSPGVILDMDTPEHRAGEVERDGKKLTIGRAELAEGKIGKAVRFTFADAAGTGFFTAPVAATPAWNEAEGFSFLVKGDRSTN
jgi:hypothetical protein